MKFDYMQGDSGGPLIVQQKPGAPWIQSGIVSWGIGTTLILVGIQMILLNEEC